MTLINVSSFPKCLSREEEEDLHERGANEVASLVGETMEMGYQSKQEKEEDEDEEFWPVEHPMEPQDEDRPVRCPMPASSLINNGRKQERRSYSDSIRKRAELPVMMNKEGAVVAASESPVRAVRKRHHTLTHGDYVMAPSTRMNFPPPQPLPPLPNQQNTSIFQMLQQRDES